MAFCTKCGAQVPDGNAFCTVCGTPVQQAAQPRPKVFCTQCGAEVPNGFSFCQVCGTPVGQTRQTPPQPAQGSSAAGRQAVLQNMQNGQGKPQQSGAPIFNAPPIHAPTRNSGPVCYYHQDQPAAAQCARCGKYICQDCFDSYGVSSGDYEGQALCYDCTKELVAENVETLKQNRKDIKRTYILTLIGVSIGGTIGVILGAENGFGAALLGLFLGAMLGGCFWTFIRNVFIRTGNAIAGSNFIVGLIVGLLVGSIIEGVLSIYRTIRKIVDCIVYMKRTQNFIESDSEALREMTDYMEYTQVRNMNKGVDIETLLAENSQLANNSIAQMARTSSEEEIEARMRGCLATINENGEIIRSYAA